MGFKRGGFVKESDDIKQLAQNISRKIKNKVEKDKRRPVGNQNCLLCTWCAEAQFRHVDVLPRPVYSPRDIIFKFANANIVKYPRKMYFNDKNEV